MPKSGSLDYTTAHGRNFTRYTHGGEVKRHQPLEFHDANRLRLGNARPSHLSCGQELVSRDGPPTSMAEEPKYQQIGPRVQTSQSGRMSGLGNSRSPPQAQTAVPVSNMALAFMATFLM